MVRGKGLYFPEVSTHIRRASSTGWRIRCGRKITRRYGRAPRGELLGVERLFQPSTPSASQPQQRLAELRLSGFLHPLPQPYESCRASSKVRLAVVFDLGRNPACRAVPSVRYSPHVPVVQLMQIFLVPAYTKPPRQLG